MAKSRREAVIPTLKFSVLEIDKKEYRLAYSYRSIALAESEARVNLLVGLENLEQLNAVQLLGLFYASLTPLNPGITIDEAADLIRLNTLEPITAALARAYRLSMERPSADKSEDPPKAAADEESEAAETETL